MTNPGKDVRAGHEPLERLWNLVDRCSKCLVLAGIRALKDSMNPLEDWLWDAREALVATNPAAHVASLPAQEPAAPAALASQVPAQPPAQPSEYCERCHKLIMRPNVNYAIHPESVCLCARANGQLLSYSELAGIYAGLADVEAGRTISFEKLKVQLAAPVPAQVKPATCCNRHSDADIAFNKEMHAWVPDIMTYPNPIGHCLCGFGRFYKISFTEWELHVQGDPRVKQQSAPDAQPMDDSIPYDGPKGKLVRIARPEARSVASQVPAQPPAQRTSREVQLTKESIETRLRELLEKYGVPEDDFLEITALINHWDALTAPASPQIADGLEQDGLYIDCRVLVESVFDKDTYHGYASEKRAIETLSIKFAEFIRTKLRAALAESDKRARLDEAEWWDEWCLRNGMHGHNGENGGGQCTSSAEFPSGAVVTGKGCDRYHRLAELRAAQPTPAPKEQR